MSMTTFVYAPAEGEIRPALQDRDLARSFFSTQNKITPILDLDKSWHGLHYLLTRSAWQGEGSHAFLIHGGDLIDLDMSSARVFWPQEAEQIDAVLAEITTDELRRRFDSQLMMREEIYPEIWDRDPKEDDTLGWLVSYFEQLKKFAKVARLETRCLVVMNEWPAESKESTSSISQPQRKWIGHVLAIFICVSVATCLYVSQPRSKWPFLVEAAFCYMIAGLFLSAGSYIAKQFLPMRKLSQFRWARYWRAGEDSIAIQGFALLLLFIVAKLVGLL